MDFLKRYITETFVVQDVGDGVDIPLIIQRFVTSQVYEDRLKGLEDLTRFSVNPIYLKDFGTKGVFTLLKSVQTELDNLILVNPLLQILLNITKITEETEVYARSYLGTLIENKMVHTILCLLSSKDVYIRLNSIELISRSLESDAVAVKEQLVKDSGIIRILNLLRDKQEVIISKGIGLLLDLTKESESGIHSELVKVIGNEKGFNLVFSIIKEEGYQDGGIVVRDCLKIIENLLVKSEFNRKKFATANCFVHFKFLLNVEGLMFSNTQNIICATLRILYQVIQFKPSREVILEKEEKIVENLIRISLRDYDKKVEKKILYISLYSLGLMVHGDRKGQEILESFVFSEDKTNQRLALVKLTYLVCNELEDETFRQIGEKSLFNFLEGNSEGQHLVASTIKPPTLITSEGETGMMTGITLTKAIFTLDHPEKNANACFHACRILCRIIRENTRIKEILLALKYELNPYYSGRSNATPFFTCLVHLVVQSLKKKVQMIPCIGLLILLCEWVRESPLSAEQFMKTTSHFLFFVDFVKSEGSVMNPHFQGLSALLLGLLCLYFPSDNEKSNKEIGGYTKITLHNAINRRIGKEKLKNNLKKLREIFEKQPKQVEVPMRENCFLLYDEEFVKESLNDFQRIEKLMENPSDQNNKLEEVNEKSMENEVENTLISEENFNVLQKRDRKSNERIVEMEKELEERKEEIVVLWDKNKDFEKQLEESFTSIRDLKKELEEKELLRVEYEEKMKRLQNDEKRDGELEIEKELIEELKEKLKKKESEILETKTSNDEEVKRLRNSIEDKKQEVSNLSSAYNELEELLKEKDEEINTSRNRFRKMKVQLSLMENKNKELKENMNKNSGWETKEMKYRSAIELLQRELNGERVKVNALKEEMKGGVKVKEDLAKRENQIQEMKEDIETMLELNDELTNRNEFLEGVLREKNISV